LDKFIREDVEDPSGEDSLETLHHVHRTTGAKDSLHEWAQVCKAYPIGAMGCRERVHSVVFLMFAVRDARRSDQSQFSITTGRSLGHAGWQEVKSNSLITGQVKRYNSWNDPESRPLTTRIAGKDRE
jgi:hypothetical protein